LREMAFLILTRSTAPFSSESTDVVIMDVDIAAVEEETADCARLRRFNPAMINFDTVWRVRRRSVRGIAELDHARVVDDAICLAHD